MSDPGAPPAGWLLDPDDPTLLRWWDGTAWAGFRRPREVTDPPPAASPPAASPPAASPPAVPSADPSSAPVPVWTPAPLPPVSGPSDDPTPDPVAADDSAPPFWQQWDDVVLAVTGAAAPDVRARRQSLAAGVRDRVVAGAAEGERVLRVLAVSVHDVSRSGREVGTRLFVADLLVTDHRLLLWADDTDPDLALIEVDLDDVVGMRALPGPAVALDLSGGGRPLVLAASDSARRPELLNLLHATVPADRPRG